MNIRHKTTGLASVAALAVGTILALAPMKASAATVLPVAGALLAGNVVEYDAGILTSDDYSFLSGINLQDAFETQIEAQLSGTGTLSIDTYVDPFATGGIGSASIRIRGGTSLPAGQSVTAEWGTSGIVDLSSGTETMLSTSFLGAGPMFSQTLLFSWTDVSQSRQLSAGVSAVPLPAGGLLLLGALGGMAAMRRRKQHAA